MGIVEYTNVNTEIDDKSDIAELMKIYSSPDLPGNNKFPKTCAGIKNLKVGKVTGSNVTSFIGLKILRCFCKSGVAMALYCFKDLLATSAIYV